MNKKIKFGSSDAFIINNLDTKSKIIDFLFNSLNLSNYRYVMLNHLDKLKYLKQNPHYVTPNYKGFNYLMLFMKINKINHCVLIDKRKLSYHKEKIDLKRVFIVKVKVFVSESIFRGSIFDCQLIRTPNQNLMLIKDCLKLMGNPLLDMEMNHKMTHLDNIINNQFNDMPSQNFIFKVNKLYKYKELNNLIKNIMESCSIPTQGLVFYPKYSGVTIVYIKKEKEKIGITSNNKPIENKSYDMIENLVEFLKNRSYSYENSKIKKKLWLKKTDITDVYDVLEKEDDKRLGIACIPNLKTSLYCQKNIKDKPVQFLCAYVNQFKKWLPLI